MNKIKEASFEVGKIRLLVAKAPWVIFGCVYTHILVQLNRYYPSLSFSVIPVIHDVE